MALDNEQQIAKQYKVRSFDTTVLLDSKGKIIYRDEGYPVSAEKLEELLSSVG
jgi:thioredoxin-related protein